MTRFLQGAAVVVSLVFAGAAFAADAPALGAAAPACKLQDQSGKWHSLSDYKGKCVVLCFYPKDNEHSLRFPIFADSGKATATANGMLTTYKDMLLMGQATPAKAS